jgi:hypothetical protein
VVSNDVLWTFMHNPNLSLIPLVVIARNLHLS